MTQLKNMKSNMKDKKQTKSFGNSIQTQLSISFDIEEKKTTCKVISFNQYEALKKKEFFQHIVSSTKSF